MSFQLVHPFHPPDGWRYARRYGINLAVGSAAYETVWTPGGLYPWQEGAQELFVASDAAGDAGQAFVRGVDASFNPISKIVTIAGTTPVSLGSDFVNLDRGRALAAFTGTVRAGFGTFTLGVPGTTMLELASTAQSVGGASKMCLAIVPAGFQMAVARVMFTARSDSDVLLWVKHPGAGGAEWEFDHHVSEAGTPVVIDPWISFAGSGVSPLPPGFDDDLGIFPAGTRVEARAKSATGNDQVACAVDLIFRRV
jgi:hypothetical protein